MPEPASYTVRPVSVGSALLTMVPLAVFLAAAVGVTGDYKGGAYIGAGLFIIYRFAFVRSWLLKDHVRGLRLTRAGKFKLAAEAFADSEQVWLNRPFLDRHRALLLGSAVRHSFYFLSRYNQAYVLSRRGKAAEALAMLDRLDEEAPGSTLVATLRDLLRAGREDETES